MAGHNDNSSNIYKQGLEKNAANYVPLSPLTFIARSAYIYPDRVSVIHGQRRYTWLETFNRTRYLFMIGGDDDAVSAGLTRTFQHVDNHRLTVDILERFPGQSSRSKARRDDNHKTHALASSFSLSRGRASLSSNTGIPSRNGKTR